MAMHISPLPSIDVFVMSKMTQKDNKTQRKRMTDGCRKPVWL